MDDPYLAEAVIRDRKHVVCLCAGVCVCVSVHVCIARFAGRRFDYMVGPQTPA